MILTLLLACTAGKDTAAADSAAADPCLPGDSPELVIGVGEQAYEPLTPGDSATLVHGPQGGYHVTMAIAARFMDASGDWLVHIQGTIGDELAAETWPYVAARCDDDEGRLEAWNMLMIFSQGWEPADLDGQLAAVEMEITDAAGTVVTATTELIIDDSSSNR
jgi:hypothetical protein